MSVIQRANNQIKPKILVVDDSKLVRLTAAKMLSELFELEFAEDGEEGWQKISDDVSIQMVFTDLGMPKLDGFGLIRRVRTSEQERIRNLPMVVITGAADEEDIRRKLFEIGATDFISKPFKATAIIARADAHTTYRSVNDQLQKNSHIDPLTGVLNDRGIHEQLQKDISFINRHSESFAIAVFELDHYQSVFDRIGKKTSDKILQETAKILLGAVRKEDSVGRHGLARFVVLLPMAKAPGVIALAKRICAKIASFKLTVANKSIALSASVGISTVNTGQSTSTSSILVCAEQALSNAQNIGVGEIQFVKFDMDDSLNDIVTLSIDDLLSQIDDGSVVDLNVQFDQITECLAPLFSLMNSDQKKILVSRING